MKEGNFSGIIEKTKSFLAPTTVVEKLINEKWFENMPKADVAIILGSVNKKSRLTIDCKIRTMAAEWLLHKEKVEQIITTGGKWPGAGDDKSSSAELEKEYLIKRLGVREEYIIEEPGKSSTSTIENFEKILDVLKGKRSVMIVSNGYHLFRAESDLIRILKENEMEYIQVRSMPAELILLIKLKTMLPRDDKIRVNQKLNKIIEHYDITKKAIDEHFWKALKRLVLETGGLFLNEYARRRAEQRKKTGRPSLLGGE